MSDPKHVLKCTEHRSPGQEQVVRECVDGVRGGQGAGFGGQRPRVGGRGQRGGGSGSEQQEEEEQEDVEMDEEFSAQNEWNPPPRK